MSATFNALTATFDTVHCNAFVVEKRIKQPYGVGPAADTGNQAIRQAAGLLQYLRPGFARDSVDFSRMTISGSVLNSSGETRNIGLAITFFDENGNQVGGEIIQINNARTDVPYPFTSTIDMALNRPFDSSSTYVLYADPAN